MNNFIHVLLRGKNKNSLKFLLRRNVTKVTLHKKNLSQKTFFLAVTTFFKQIICESKEREKERVC